MGFGIQVHMSRPLRIEYPGAHYHVINRGLTGQAVFTAEPDFMGFLDLIEDAWRRWDILVFAYCLMDTHYHMAIQTPYGNLQRIMRHIDGVYTQRFNRVHRRDGPLFRGRYKGIVIDADAYLAAVVRYIHLNPLETGKAENPEDYPWSSHRHYLRPGKAPKWLAIQQVLDGYGTRRGFHEFVLSGNEEALLQFYSSKKRSPGLGEEDFISSIKRRDFSISSEHVCHETRVLRPGTSPVVKVVAEIYQFAEDALFQTRRGQRNEARQVAMYLIRELCDLSLKEIAWLFSLGSYGSVGSACSVINSQIQSDKTLRHRIEQIRERLSLIYSQKKT
jgi:REP element-mobilizing transposase RayT